MGSCPRLSMQDSIIVVAPPVVTRAYQELSRGIVNLQNGAFLASHSFRLVHMLGCSCPCRMTTCPCSSGKIAEFPFPFPLAQVSSRVAFKGYIAFGVLFILHAQHGSWSGSPIEVWPCYACTGPLFQPLVEALTVQQRQLSGFCSRNCVATSESLRQAF